MSDGKKLFDRQGWLIHQGIMHGLAEALEIEKRADAIFDRVYEILIPRAPEGQEQDATQFIAAYDLWVQSDEHCDGPLFDAMVEARKRIEG